MIAIENTLVSEDLLNKHFMCNLSACKGACCVKGDQGAPLLIEESKNIVDNLDSILPYLPTDQQERILTQGFARTYPDGDFGTHLMDDGACVFVIRENGIVFCGIEKAFKEGKSTFQKPVSCHLYPVRVKEYKEFVAVNYDRWEICSPACQLGDELKVPIYLFVENALIRRFGQDWMDALKSAAAHIEGSNIK